MKFTGRRVKSLCAVFLLVVVSNMIFNFTVAYDWCAHHGSIVEKGMLESTKSVV